MILSNIKKYLKNVFAILKSICIVKMSIIKIESTIILNNLEFLLQKRLLYYCRLN